LTWLVAGREACRRRWCWWHVSPRCSCGRWSRSQQSDTTALDAQFFTPHLVSAFKRAQRSTAPELATLADDARVVEAIGRLTAWDHSTPTGIPEGYDAADTDGRLAEPSATEISHSVAATIYAVWRGQFIRNVIDNRLAVHQLRRPGSADAIKALKTLLVRYPHRGGVGMSGIDFFAVPGVADAADRRDVLLLKSLRDALDLLASPAFEPAFHGSLHQADYRWGNLHRVTFSSPLGMPWSIPPAHGAFPPPVPGLDGIPTDGGFGTVDVAPHPARAAGANDFMFRFGPTRRMIAQADNVGMRSTSALPGGVSEHRDNQHRLNLLPRWLTNDTYPVRLRDGDLATATRRHRIGPVF
jgi:penicillin amidase